jgi:hypothetical protein
MNDGIEWARRRRHRCTIGNIDSANRVRLSHHLPRVRPAFHFPSRRMKQVGRGGADVTAAGNQNPRHHPATGAISISSNSSDWIGAPASDGSIRAAPEVTTISTREAMCANNSVKRMDLPPARLLQNAIDLIRNCKIFPEHLAQIVLASRRLSTF